MSNSNLYFETQSWSMNYGGIGLIARNGGSGIKVENGGYGYVVFFQSSELIKGFNILFICLD